MDFLVFISIYLLVFGVIIILYYYADSAVLQNKLVKFMTLLVQFLVGLIPSCLKSLVFWGIDRMFYQRNHILQILYSSLVVAGHVVLVVDIFPIVYTFAANENHVLLPLSLVLVNAVCFSLTCTSDPGEITHTTQKHYSPAYAYDTLMYKEGVKCRTCLIPKLPRSKHCSICDRCVYRFDHHCIWTNNCIGGLNHIYFILFLLSIVIMSVNGVVICWRTLMLVVNHFNMLETSYVDQSGSVQPVTLMVLAQHLFLNFPRIVFTMVSLVFVVLGLGSFALYHIFLMVTNQTTNERYKRDAIVSQRDEVKSGSPSKGPKPSLAKNQNSNLYDGGVLRNIYEIVFPKKFLHDMIKKM